MGCGKRILSTKRRALLSSELLQNWVFGLKLINKSIVLCTSGLLCSVREDIVYVNCGRTFGG